MAETLHSMPRCPPRTVLVTYLIAITALAKLLVDGLNVLGRNQADENLQMLNADEPLSSSVENGAGTLRIATENDRITPRQGFAYSLGTLAYREPPK